MGMTWSFKVQRVAFALGVIAVLAIASAADWWNCFFDYFW
jgi:hypothetical protein